MKAYDIFYRAKGDKDNTVFETNITAENLKQAKQRASEEFRDTEYTVVRVKWNELDSELL